MTAPLNEVTAPLNEAQLDQIRAQQIDDRYRVAFAREARRRRRLRHIAGVVLMATVLWWLQWL